MVRGPEEQFAHQIEKIRAEEGFKSGSVIKKKQNDGTGKKYGPYVYLVSPPSYGREWYYLGKYKEEIDLDERAEMDFKRLIFRYKELDRWYLARQLEDTGVHDPVRDAYCVPLDSMREAKDTDGGYQQAWRDTLFSRGSFECQTVQQAKLTVALLHDLQEEINELHLDEEELDPPLRLVVNKRNEWGKIPSDYERFVEAVETGETPKFIN